MTTKMTVTILGSGTSTGVPMVGCGCRVCSSTDPRDKRTRASLLIQAEGNYILIDTSTDLRNQALRQNIPHIDAVLFTHSHADHIHGIDDLRGFHFIHKRLVPCFADQETYSVISATFSYIFKGLESEGYAPLLDPHIISGEFELFGLHVIPIPLVHGHINSTGYRIGGFAYLTDVSHIPESSIAMLQGLDLLIIDALRYTPHYTHFNIEGAQEIVKKLNPKRTIFTHLTHEVAYEDRENLPVGIDFAYDGMTFEL